LAITGNNAIIVLMCLKEKYRGKLWKIGKGENVSGYEIRKV